MRWLTLGVLEEAQEQDRLDLASPWLWRRWRLQGAGLPRGQRVDGQAQAPSLLPLPGVLIPCSPPAGRQRGLLQSSGTGSLVLDRTPQSRLEPGGTWLSNPQSPPGVNSTRIMLANPK